jgi:regulatory protein
LTDSDQVRDGYLLALRLLTGQDYTALALQRKLLARKFTPESTRAVLEQLGREGLLNDQRYAERFVAAARETGRFTGYRLRQELQRRGVPSEVADELLQDPPDLGDELEQARQLVSRRYRGFHPQSADEPEKRRISGFLQRRGYPVSIIMQVINHTY